MHFVEEWQNPGHRRWRPGSLDLNGHGQNLVASSFHPLSGDDAYSCNSRSTSTCGRANMFPSPETPNFRHSGAGVASYQKGWSSERIPLSASRGRKYGSYGGNAPMFPFNNGRTMPSKWEDAEKWICSPVSSDGSRRPLMLPPYQRRPNSQRGPLGALALPGGSCQPALLQIPCFENGRVASFTGSSPFLAGVLVTEQQFYGGDVEGRDGQEGHDGLEKTCPPNSEASTDRSTSVSGWLDMLVEPCALLPKSDVDRLDCIKEAATVLSQITTRRDVGTQISPEGSMHSSPKRRFSPSLSPSAFHTITNLQNHFQCLEIKDVQVDDRVTVTKWSKKHFSWCSDRRSTDIIEWERKMVESPASDLEVVVTKRYMSKYDRVEAKVTAWENLQKAKAESAVQKLEMKLEKRRSSSTGKILKRLRSAQRKADTMRSSVVHRQAGPVPRNGGRFSYFGKYVIVSSLCACFTCHAF
ncbi:hypothetical protein IEQ34_019790 [Dendrobium chrysotoxum]|uniref:Remorin C-terminal domain-containing protein n=1 Tax=Dendrobium chrysotoxum TaxID=161865 RepID=A0AAV7G7T9_DENCH|nr:hypothetical protein IEQ34_019790 [Dendrobium chrysotoxum]